MSIVNHTGAEHYALMYICLECYAAPNVWCRTVEGAIPELHQIRIRPLTQYGEMKYIEGFELAEAGATLDFVEEVVED
jgi:hypothetical protein